ncbi:MAG TPA: hypothetical protein PKY50_16285, partial [Candidatus Competibacter sp.]|nr:hypothetical protein [Candidatus Competibacter sp.]
MAHGICAEGAVYQQKEHAKSSKKSSVAVPDNADHAIRPQVSGAIEKGFRLCKYWRPQGDSNPCYRRERAVS